MRIQWQNRVAGRGRPERGKPSLFPSTIRFQDSSLRPESGQAMIEFIVGMVAMIVLLAVLIQFCGFEWEGERIPGLLSAQTDTMVEARKEAGERAVSELPTLSSPEYIRDWDEGADGNPHTPDDVVLSYGDSFAFHDTILDKSVEDASQWDILNAYPNYFSQLRGYYNPSIGFGLVDGTAEENGVPILSAIRELVYAAPSIDVKSEVWMTWTKGVYGPSNP